MRTLVLKWTTFKQSFGVASRSGWTKSGTILATLFYTSLSAVCGRLSPWLSRKLDDESSSFAARVKATIQLILSLVFVNAVEQMLKTRAGTILLMASTLPLNTWRKLGRGLWFVFRTGSAKCKGGFWSCSCSVAWTGPFTLRQTSDVFLEFLAREYDSTLPRLSLAFLLGESHILTLVKQAPTLQKETV